MIYALLAWSSFLHPSLLNRPSIVSSCTLRHQDPFLLGPTAFYGYACSLCHIPQMYHSKHPGITGIFVPIQEHNNMQTRRTCCVAPLCNRDEGLCTCPSSLSTHPLPIPSLFLPFPFPSHQCQCQ
ncbi:MAG: hypothetical protein BYD32DRAFT_247712 [Podila humilis]|nr:MAG: hypothetical protein BYD32DRAFT_247712 [Podila humilis]